MKDDRLDQQAPARWCNQRDYERLLAFRTGLRRFLHWSGQQAEAAGLVARQPDRGDGRTVRLA